MASACWLTSSRAVGLCWPERSRLLGSVGDHSCQPALAEQAAGELVMRSFLGVGGLVPAERDPALVLQLGVGDAGQSLRALRACETARQT